MYSTAYFLVVVAFYLAYNRSRRSRLSGKPGYLRALERHRLFSAILGTVLLFAALIWFIGQLGPGAGAFGFVVALMSAGCFVVVLAPFRYFGPIHLCSIYVLCVAVELFLF